ncbi:MAG: DNA-directed RNA polymerase subunit omega [Filifactoraceae bacterium]
MLKPSINELLKKSENRYVLVNLVAIRARAIVNNGEEGHIFVDINERKPVSIATQEVFEDQITYKSNYTEAMEKKDYENRDYNISEG